MTDHADDITITIPGEVTMSDQTPEARLAAALEGCDDFDCGHRLVRSDPINGDIWWMRCRAMAAAILAADPTLAADLALAAAVRGLGDDWWLDQVTRKDGSTRFAAHIYPSGRHGTGPTLVAAIEEASDAD